MKKRSTQATVLKRRIAELECEVARLRKGRGISRVQDSFKGNRKHLEPLLESVDRRDSKSWNAWRRNNRGIIPDLRGVNLDQCSLPGLDLRHANLRSAQFEYADLLKAKFDHCRLRDSSFLFTQAFGAFFTGADCRNACFRHANFERAAFTSSKLQDIDGSEAFLEKAKLSRANLKRADLSKTVMKSADLTGAILDEAEVCFSDLTLANLTGASMRSLDATGANLGSASLSNADCRAAEFRWSSLNGADLSGADLRRAQMLGASTWEVRCDEETKQRNLRYEIWHETAGDFYDLSFDNIEMGYLLSLFLQNPKLEQIFNASTSKLVLILGRFSDPARFGILEALRDELPMLDYVPIVFDFDKPTARDSVEVISTLAGLSRFVICDLTQAKSTPLETHVIVPHMSIPFVPIIARGDKEFSMFDALRSRYSWVLPTVEYRSKKQLIDHLEEAILAPAEKKLRALARQKSKTRMPIPIEAMLAE